MSSHLASAVMPFDGPTAVTYGLFVEAAYTMYDADPTNQTPAPSRDFPGGYRLTSWITMQDFIVASETPSFYGFIAQSTTDASQFVLAIRGTASAVEWWDDLNAVVLEPFKDPGFGSVGDGFARIYDTLTLIEDTPTAAPRSLKAVGSFAAQVEDHVSRAAPVGATAQPQTSMIVVAHSLGSALATLYVADNAGSLRVQNPLICTFASPYVGDQTFAAAFDALDMTSWRVAISTDVVPMLPPAALGFVHVDVLHSLVMSWDSRWYWPPCAHSLMTYLNLLDPSLPVSPSCQASTASQRARSAVAL